MYWNASFDNGENYAEFPACELATQWDIPSWSLAALLDLLPFPQLSKDKLGSGKVGWMVSVYPDNCRYDSCWNDNPIDACYETIIKLHELNMEIEEFILLKEIETSASSFLQNLKIGDKVVVELRDSIYREAVIESVESCSAPSGATYINVSVFNKILSTNKKYTVPIWDLYPLGSKKIVYTAYIYSLSPRGPDFSGRGSYKLVCEGKILKKVEGCFGRKNANERLLDEDMLRNYGINQVYSNDLIIYNK